jgi:hypothetical protein
LNASRELDSKVAREILSYFVRHPHAADDLEGIARWRLVEDAIRLKVEETHRALDELVDQGFLIRTMSGPTPVFSLNQDAVAEAEALLAGDDSKPAKEKSQKRSDTDRG